MGLFATTTSLQTLLPGVTFDAATTSLASMCITHAESHIRTSLARRYNFANSPFNTSTSIPTSLTSITEQLAMGYYFKNSSRGSKESISRGEALIREAKDLIKEIANFGADLLDNSYAVIASSQAQVTSSTSDYTATMDEDDPLDWQPDQDKLDDIETDRL